MYVKIDRDEVPGPDTTAVFVRATIQDQEYKGSVLAYFTSNAPSVITIQGTTNGLSREEFAELLSKLAGSL